MVSDFDAYSLFLNRRKIDIKQNLRMSKDMEYIIEVEEKLKKAEDSLGESCVIGLWGHPLPHGQAEGYGIYTKREIDDLLAKQKSSRTLPIHLSNHYFDLSWFQRKKERLSKKDWVEVNGQIVYDA